VGAAAARQARRKAAPVSRPAASPRVVKPARMPLSSLMSLTSSPVIAAGHEESANVDGVAAVAVAVTTV